ncbi:MAG: sodium-dependent transporter [Lentisphaeria bacterium]|nr:sodium-dependent transporter [Lentisphaeria bacterium]
MEHLAARHGGVTYAVDKKGTTIPVFTRDTRTAVAQSAFGQFIDNPTWAIGYHFAFMGLCVLIVCLGVQGGIERASKILMPLLILLLIILIIRGVTLEGSAAGIRFFLSPDFSKLNAESVLLALGHAFFSLSLGMGAMITYGSYVGKEQNLFTSALSITALDTLIALLAGLAIFPAVFAMGFDPSGGPGLVFHVLPTVFSEMRLSLLWATLFFLLLFVAALTSGISLLEVVTAYFVDELKWSRKLASIVFGGVIFLLGCVCALGVGDWDRIHGLKVILVTLFDQVPSNFLDVMTTLSDNWLLPLGGLFIAIFVGWVWGTRKALDEIRHGSRNFGDVHVVSLLAGLKDDHSHNSPVHVLTLASIWGFFIRFISPVAVLIAFFHAIGWLDFGPAEKAKAPSPATTVVSEEGPQGDTGE